MVNKIQFKKKRQLLMMFSLLSKVTWWSAKYHNNLQLLVEHSCPLQPEFLVKIRQDFKLHMLIYQTHL